MRTVIIGGTTGVGLATAKLLSEQGHEVIVTGRAPERVEQAAKEAGGAGYVVDARDEQATRDFFDRIGPVDNVVINVSGRGQAAGPLSAITADALRQAVEDKLIPHFLTAKAAATALSERGSITFVAAASAGAAFPGSSGLAAINGAIEAVVPGLAVELAPVRVNAVSPGVVDTEWWSWLDEAARAEAMKGFAAASPLNRVAEPADIASAIAFVVGNAFTTGTVLTVDGGGKLKA